MKLYNLILAIASLFFLVSCKDKFTESFDANVPVYKSFSDWRSEPIELLSPRSPHQTGKIYVYKHYLLVNEHFRGIHIFDNSDPANPTSIGFLPILGNVDMAIRNDRLYTDSYMDLLTFDVKDMSNPKLVCRSQGLFEFNAYNLPPGYDETKPIVDFDPTKGIIVKWEQKRITQDIQTYTGKDLGFVDNITFMPTAGSIGSGNVGVGGSMARFTISNDHLYTLETRQLTSFNLDSDCPENVNEQIINRNCETIFPSRDHLFLGTTTGMVIYSLNNPASPNWVSNYDHINACDPVIVQNDRAYVTLRSGNACVGTVNRLVVLDVANLSNPTEITFYNLSNPHGLGIDGKTLFVCDGYDGLKVFDATDDFKILQNQIAHYKSIMAVDVIPYNNVLIGVFEDGIRQFDYSNPMSINQISYIPVQ